MDAFGVLDEVLADYQAFVSGFLTIRDPDVRSTVNGKIERGLLRPEPWLALNPSFETAGSIGTLVDEGLLHPACRAQSRQRTTEDPTGVDLVVRRHQREAIEAARPAARMS